MTDFERQLRHCDTESLNDALRQYGIEPTYDREHVKQILDALTRRTRQVKFIANCEKLRKTEICSTASNTEKKSLNK